jgi:hypothetical protein
MLVHVLNELNIYEVLLIHDKMLGITYTSLQREMVETSSTPMVQNFKKIYYTKRGQFIK